LGLVLGLGFYVKLQGPYINPSVSTCNLTNPTNRIIPNGKTTPAVLLPLIAK